ncbi:MAG: hypothetical protein P3W97_009060 [Tepidimonas sp.]|uniref:hypothetical protein n=1 Tax=Tepidimonas sp. TaxID=2002775 RepID=UPI00259E4330|nr:hypothetical protein [Tepidimonas sp.]MDM7457381.1 hypothetical protein [Tepidimonas sp.]
MIEPPIFFRPGPGTGPWWPPTPPAWLLDEVRNRLVLLLNHVLQQEPEAMQRLRRHEGKRVRVRWGRAEPSANVQDFGLVLRISPAGLLESAADDARADLRLAIDEPSPLTLAGKLLRGDKPAVAIEGDVQFAAEIAWLVDNVRWDVEEDLARLLGDAMAHTLVQTASAAASALRAWIIPAAQAARERAAALRERVVPQRAPHDNGRAAP